MLDERFFVFFEMHRLTRRHVGTRVGFGQAMFAAKTVLAKLAIADDHGDLCDTSTGVGVHIITLCLGHALILYSKRALNHFSHPGSRLERALTTALPVPLTRPERVF